MEKDHKRLGITCMRCCRKATVTNMATTQNFEFIYEKLDFHTICTSAKVFMKVIVVAVVATTATAVTELGICS
jgi:hypothetical protein